MFLWPTNLLKSPRAINPVKIELVSNVLESATLSPK